MKLVTLDGLCPLLVVVMRLSTTKDPICTTFDNSDCYCQGCDQHGKECYVLVHHRRNVLVFVCLLQRNVTVLLVLVSWFLCRLVLEKFFGALLCSGAFLSFLVISRKRSCLVLFGCQVGAPERTGQYDVFMSSLLKITEAGILGRKK